MCYTGKCKYENYYGDCVIKDSNYPEDAACTMGYFDGNENEFEIKRME